MLGFHLFEAVRQCLLGCLSMHACVYLFISFSCFLFLLLLFVVAVFLCVCCCCCCCLGGLLGFFVCLFVCSFVCLFVFVFCLFIGYPVHLLTFVSSFEEKNETKLSVEKKKKNF